MCNTFPRTWHDTALVRGMPVSPDDTYSGEAYAAVGVAILNGCASCGATVAPYNSYQIAEDNPYPYCKQCTDMDPGN